MNRFSILMAIAIIGSVALASADPLVPKEGCVCDDDLCCTWDAEGVKCTPKAGKAPPPKEGCVKTDEGTCSWDEANGVTCTLDGNAPKDSCVCDDKLCCGWDDGKMKCHKAPMMQQEEGCVCEKDLCCSWDKEGIKCEEKGNDLPPKTGCMKGDNGECEFGNDGVKCTLTNANPEDTCVCDDKMCCEWENGKMECHPAPKPKAEMPEEGCVCEQDLCCSWDANGIHCNETGANLPPKDGCLSGAAGECHYDETDGVNCTMTDKNPSDTCVCDEKHCCEYVGDKFACHEAPKMAGVDSDPHLLLNIDGSDTPICYDLTGVPGHVYQLVHDPSMDLTVNGQLVGISRLHDETWFGKISIIHGKQSAIIAPDQIIIGGEEVRKWAPNTLIQLDDMLSIHIESNAKMTVTFGDRVKFSLLSHMFKRRKAGRISHLGFFIENMKGLTDEAFGLLGQFSHASVSVNRDINEAQKTKDKFAQLRFPRSPERRPVNVSVMRRRDFLHKKNILCWFVHANGRMLIHGDFMDYLVDDLKYSKKPTAFLK